MLTSVPLQNQKNVLVIEIKKEWKKINGYSWLLVISNHEDAKTVWCCGIHCRNRTPVRDAMARFIHTFFRRIFLSNSTHFRQQSVWDHKILKTFVRRFQHVPHQETVAVVGFHWKFKKKALTNKWKEVRENRCLTASVFAGCSKVWGADLLNFPHISLSHNSRPFWRRQSLLHRWTKPNLRYNLPGVRIWPRKT